MNNYESFKQIDHSVEKPGGTLFKRMFSKLNKKESNNNLSDIRTSPTVEKKVVASVDTMKTDKEKRNKPSTNDNKKTVKENTSSIDAYRRTSLNPLQGTSSSTDLRYDDTMTFTKLLKTIKNNVSTTMSGSSENLPIKHKLNRIYWMPDSICNKCYFCEDEFTAIRRRHHCRMCGQIFCYRCCAFELPGHIWNQTKPQRSCQRCFQSFYSESGKRRASQLSALNVSHSDTASISHDNRSCNSPTFSARSENIIDVNQNLESSNRNISFSSNDVSTNPLYGYNEPQLNQSKDMDDFDTLKRNSSVPEFIVTNCESDDVKNDRKISPSILNPRAFIQNHFLRTIPKPLILQPQAINSEICPKVQKQILLQVWKEIIEETDRLRDNYFNKVKIQIQTRSMESQYSFPNEDESVEPYDLNVIFTNAVSSKSCIQGCSLVNWILYKIEEVKDRFHVIAICQSYLEMQLLSPCFPSDSYKTFKDDTTLYVIRECSSDYSPRSANKEYDCNHFTDFELRGYLSSSSFQKSCGNSTFYGEEDSEQTDTNERESEKLLQQHPSPFVHIHADERIDASNEAYYNKSSTIIWNRSCEYLERLLKQELRDCNLDISWSNIILPICKLISETVSPNISDARRTNDIRQYIQIKKIPDSVTPDCEIIHSVSMSKNADFPIQKEAKNPSVMLIRSSIDYWRHKKLVSLDPLLLQEEEYLKNCVRKILILKPDIVVVEGNVSLMAKEIMEISGLILVSNVRKVQMDRLARMLGTIIFDSVDSLGGNVDIKLGRCSHFSVKSFRLSNGRHKYLLFFKLFNNKDGCTLLLHSKSLSDLVRLKYITKFMIMAFRNAYLELACLKNFQIRFLGYKGGTMPSVVLSGGREDQSNDKTFAFLDIIESRAIALSPNVYYPPSSNIIRKLKNPELQNRLLSLNVLDLSWKEKLHDILKRKQRHIFSEIYDEIRMKTRRHPLIKEPVTHAFLNCFHDRQLNNNERCVLYSDFRSNGSRFHEVNKNIDVSLISSRNFDSSDTVINGGFLTRDQETRWRDLEKKRFDSIWESFNPRNYGRILLLYSIQTPTGICDKPRKISLSYYEISDKTLGNFVSSMLSDLTVCPIKCEAQLLDHVYKFVHNGGCIEVSVHQMESESHRKFLNTISSPDVYGVPSIKLWNWCSRCDKILNLREMTEETWNLSLGRFFDLIFNLNTTDVNLVPSQCGHSLQTDIQYYFTQSNNSRALEIKYVPVTVYEFQSPELLVTVSNNRTSEEMVRMFRILQKQIENVTEIKTKYNLDIKARILKLKAESKVEDSDLWNFLKQDSNSEQYSQTMEKIHNLMEEIFSSNEDFNVELFKKHEYILNAEISQLWIDVVHFVRKWDQKLHEAYEREEKEKKQAKIDAKNIKSSNEDLLTESDILISKSCTNPLLLHDPAIKDVIKEVSLMKNISYSNDVSQEMVDGKNKCLWNSYEDKNTAPSNTQSSYSSRPISRTSTSESFDNVDEAETLVFKKERNNNPKVSDNDLKVNLLAERPSANTTSSLTLKFFANFFNSNNLKILEEPAPSDVSYVFPDIWSISDPVVVKDDSITSVISFALSSNVYQEKLNEMNQFYLYRPKLESASTVCPTQDIKLSSEIGQIDGFTNPNMFPNDVAVITKDRPIISTLDTSIKDRELCVRYLNRPDVDEQPESDFVDNLNFENKTENEDIKIEVLTDDVVTDEFTQKPFAIPKVPPAVNKKNPKIDFEISFSNHKVKCFCRIYNALQFHQLREAILGSDQQCYIRSLNECKHWVTTGGKSGLKFRKSMDDRYIIKQVHQMELSGFKKFHEKYFDYVLDRVKKKQKCVLAKILGIYHVDYSNSVTKVTEKLDFLVMENLFYNQKPVKIFDLKGNKQIAVNVTAEKLIASDTSVMQDKDFINYTRSKPIYVSWQTQIALKETLTRDTDFLTSLPVMDYSLLVGVDDTNQVLVIGIIDYLRKFTVDKLLEMYFKQKILTPNGELPTIIQPQKYQKRFLEAMEEYFLICPSPWDCLLLYPSGTNSLTNSTGRYPDYNGQIPTSQKTKGKSGKLKRSFEKNIDENILRFGLFESV